MKTYEHSTQLVIEELLTFSQEDSLVSHLAMPESEKERRMTATSGRRCLESLSRFTQVGWWQKTFLELLIGTGEWYSSKCRLTWQLRGTRYGRLYCRLVPSTRRISVAEFGSLPTPTAMDAIGIQALRQSTKRGLEKGWKKDMSLTHYLAMEMLPTPTAANARQGGHSMDGHGNPLLPMAASQLSLMEAEQQIEAVMDQRMDFSHPRPLLPTPTAISDAKGGCTRPDKKRQNDTLAHAIHGAIGQPGKTSQLNPRFVAQMMGFPVTWTEFPFRSGDKGV